MRILQVNKFHFLNGGSEFIYFGISNLLREHGHEVFHFSMKDPRNFPCAEERYFIESVQYSGAGALRKVKNAASVVYSFEARRKMAELLDAHPVDVVHLHNFHHQITPSILPVIAARKIPIVMTTHDLKIACPNYRMLTHDGICERCKGHNYYQCVLHACTKNSKLASVFSAIEMYWQHWRRYLDLIDRFITPSAFYRDKFIEFGFPAERITHVPNFVEVHSFTYHNTPGDHLLYLGRLSPEKGIMTLLEAMRSATDTKLVIAGTGPMAEEVSRYVTEHRMQNVELAGHCSAERVRELLAGSYAVVLPSEWYETFGLCIVEAFASGRPVIGSRIGAIPDIIEDRKTGLLFPPGDAAALAACIRELANDRERAAEMGTAARAAAEAHYGPETFYERVLGVYDDVLESRRAGATSGVTGE